ncbi:Tn3 family transposase [Streptomyces sp. NPDC019443]|uniref:Tn3 family transposase n=1 Tax=Streptomyces sp. NPDC019443 TaxID=3365061 RepID=UPI00378883C0
MSDYAVRRGAVVPAGSRERPVLAASDAGAVHEDLIRPQADAEQVLRRCTRGGRTTPRYRAIEKLGRAVRTAFTSDYLAEADGPL